MPDPSNLRDSTQIVVPCHALDGVRDGLHEKFTLTIYETDGRCRIIGSPVEIKDASDYLTRHGIAVD